jgi:hypothetical protein
MKKEFEKSIPPRVEKPKLTEETKEGQEEWIPKTPIALAVREALIAFGLPYKVFK